MIDVFGAGAFGTAMAIVLARGGSDVTLWAREGAEAISTSREAPRLPGTRLPDNIHVVGDLKACRSKTALFAIPTQALVPFLASHDFAATHAVSCAKGITLATGQGPAQILAEHFDVAAQLTGPSFASDLAQGLPTALTLACSDDDAGTAMQAALGTPQLRLYRTTDVIGAELGGALKNVIALACGAIIGQGLGNSARAALMTRGFTEMSRLAVAMGADPRTLSGLSGMGDLALTCYSEQARNFRRGLALGRGDTWDEDTTVEGVTTTQATAVLARRLGVDMPITFGMAEVLDGRSSLAEAIASLLNRPQKEE